MTAEAIILLVIVGLAILEVVWAAWDYRRFCRARRHEESRS